MKKILFLLLTMSVIVACQSEWHSDWETPTDNVAPQPVTDAVQAQRIPGGAIITYTKPADADLLGIKAVYDRSEEKKGIEEYSTTNSIKLEGFNDTLVHIVTLYAIDQSRNLSTPVEVPIQPYENVINEMIKTLVTVDAVGGVRLQWDNPTQTPVTIEISEWDTLSQRFEKINQYVWDTNKEYNKINKLDFPRDSLIPVYEYEYNDQGEIVDSTHATYKTGIYQGVEINDTIFSSHILSFRFMDRYENYSNSHDTIHTPLPEQIINPFDEWGNDLWAPYQSADGSHGDPLMGDMTHSTQWNLMFVDNAEPDHVGDEVWCAVLFMNNTLTTLGQIPQSQMPIYITIDLGEEVQLFTLRFKCRERSPIGTSRYAADFEVWGSLTPKSDEDFRNADGIIDTIASLAYWTGWEELNGYAIDGYDGWTEDGSWTKLHNDYYKGSTLMTSLESILPSGIIYHEDWPGAVLSSEDEEFLLTTGFTFDLDNPTPMRYLRFKINNTTDHTGRNEFQFLQLKGQYEKK